MDDLHSKGQSLEQALRELDIINAWLGGNALTLKPLQQAILKAHSQNPVGHITILDLGCGSGAMLQKIIRWGRKKGISLIGIGIDANPNVIRYAREFNKAYPEIEFKEGNVLDFDQIPTSDFTLCTLFLHHFSASQLRSILSTLSQKTRQQLIINDLHRHAIAYYAIKWLTHLFSHSAMVKNDACLSVWRGFKRKEWVQILENIPLRSYKLKWRWAFRWSLAIEV